MCPNTKRWPLARTPRRPEPGSRRWRGRAASCYLGRSTTARCSGSSAIPRKAVQYVVGNPLYAIEMTRHTIGAALYVPLRVLIYEDNGGKTRIEYDRPSSFFGQFGDTWVDEIAASLDRKLADLASEAMR